LGLGSLRPCLNWLHLAANVAGERDRRRRLEAQLTEACHLSRLTSFIALVPGCVIRGEEVEAAGSAQASCTSRCRGPLPTKETDGTSLLWHLPPPALGQDKKTGETEGGGQTGEHDHSSLSHSSLLFDEDHLLRAIWGSAEEHKMTSLYLLPPAISRQPAPPHAAAPRVVIHEPRHGQDMVFEAFSDKRWEVRATVQRFAVGADVGYACVFLDGLYKGCSVDSDVSLWLDDPGLDYTWHLLEIRSFFSFLSLNDVLARMTHVMSCHQLVDRAGVSWRAFSDHTSLMACLHRPHLPDELCSCCAQTLMHTGLLTTSGAQ